MTSEQLTGQVTSHLVEALIGQKQFLVHQQVAQDLLALKHAADQAGFNLNIASGFRDFDRQLAIWNGKMSGERAILDRHCQPIDSETLSDADKAFAILRWSALPGASRHHWGTEFDVFDRNSLPLDTQLQLEPWEYLTGHQARFYQWLTAHLTQFGFFFPYAKDKGGVSPEPWHISHQKTAQGCMMQLSVSTLRQQLQAQPIIGKESVLDNLEQFYTQFITNIS
ncbi:D-alanyl-D-alanine carboxypeptidase family protein [Vibrio sinensis]|uniref:D-alanyl-D-alanine carboxypeptidase family protein n=1 Tax=Vibrio sinensis TaxID=2302434 RepID=A0A3A6QMD5_9VIBR|nr:M15 family metallopeptidase [Vibrio sinensis]RJX67517.1 D-alanyl-D-alanine carboxypeptidase family protein [Vibrio sinensis]